MLIKTKGLVLKQRNIGENDRVITILTKEYGVIEAFARHVKRIRSPLTAATQVLCYSEFCIFQGRKNNSINTAETIESFYSLRLDVVKLALAVYFCDVVCFISPQEDRAWTYLRLLLNSLALLEQDKKKSELLKSVFELKLMSLAGFMPDLTCCADCAEYITPVMYFLPVDASLYCDGCIKKLSGEYIKYTVPPAVLYALRHIIYSEDEKLFQFNLKGDSLKQLSFITENYLLIQTDHRFQSLDFYKQMLL